VPEGDLAALTAGASVVVYPSLYEGFGLPVMQAMAAGVPVITSNVSSLPEIAGGAAVLVDPKQTGEITAALERVLLNPSIAAELSTRGRTRSAAFRWDACAVRSIAFFRAVVQDERLR
jgi:alpha-1,3-rhamnosyl/mannosyltransferase